MTPQQKETLAFIERFTLAHGYSPSFDEIREELGLRSKAGVKRLTDSLLLRGYLRREGARTAPRALVVVKPESSGLRAYSSELLRAELARRGEAA